MTIPSPLSDACPQCFPGDFPPVLPLSVTRDGASLRAVYRHDACGTTWPCWWDPSASGWPQPVPSLTLVPAQGTC